MNLRPIEDNVAIVLEPLPEKRGALHLAHGKNADPRGFRTARVLAVGPGHYTGCKKCGTTKCTFIPTDPALKPGVRVIVSRTAGQNFDLDVSATRQNLNTEFQELLGARGEFRIVRADEIHAIVDDDALVEAAA